MESSANSAEKSFIVPPEDPYKSMEFEKFLEILEDTPVTNWSIIAQGLGVDRNTILAWRRTPQAQKILKNALQEVLIKMREAGEADWRMWREYAKLLGIDDVQTLEIKDATGILDKLETDYESTGRQAEGQVVAPESSIQNQG